MYICDSCGALCEDPPTCREYHGFTYGGYELLFRLCECGGDWEEAEYCDCCRLPFRECDLAWTDEGRLCDECNIGEEEEKAPLPDVCTLLMNATGQGKRTTAP